MTDRPVLLVTGASRGIGRAIALRSADAYDVLAVARDGAALQALAREVEERHGGRCRPIPLDVTDAAAVSAALRGERVDVLVNNAGVMLRKPLVELALEEWRRVLDVNVNALYHVTRAVLPGMLDRGRGHVVTIGSMSGRGAFAGGTAYVGTKHFVLGFSESLLLEVRDRGVKVSVVMPGSTNTGLSGGGGAASWKLDPAAVADVVRYVVDAPGHTLVSAVEVRPLRPPGP